MTVTRKYLDYAQTAADILTENWFGPDAPQRWVPADFWRTPNIMMALNGLMGLTGSNQYQQTLDNGLKAYSGLGYPCAYYDDEAWWGAAFLRIYARTKDERYLSAAVGLFKDLSGGWDDHVGGGVWFKRYPKDYSDNDKNSVSTSLYFEIAGLLFGSPAKQSHYLDAAKRASVWMQRLIDGHALVWGNLRDDGRVEQSNPPRPYTQGTMLGALTALYDATKDPSLLDWAIKIADVTLDSMIWPGGVLRDTYEVLGDQRPDLLDPILFKPILARYLGEFAVRLAAIPERKAAATRYADFLRLNADAVWVNYPQHIFGMDWHLPQPNYKESGVLFYDGSLQSGALDLFLAAARVDFRFPSSTPTTSSPSTAD
jgi:predicted alpha-1,6-mannanase (GH76 family)